MHPGAANFNLATVTANVIILSQNYARSSAWDSRDFKCGSPTFLNRSRCPSIKNVGKDEISHPWLGCANVLLLDSMEAVWVRVCSKLCLTVASCNKTSAFSLQSRVLQEMAARARDIRAAWPNWIHLSQYAEIDGTHKTRGKASDVDHLAVSFIA